MFKDIGLIIRLKCGDAEALGQIYQRYKDGLLSITSSLLVSGYQAEDVLSEAWGTFAEAVPRLGLGADLRSRLTSQVVRIVQERLRDTIYQVTELDIGKYQSSAFKGGDQSTAPEEMAELLKSALATVPLQQREAIVLHLAAGLSFQEIAALQGVSAGTAQGRYRYGIEKLKSLPGGAIETILMAPVDRLEEAVRELRRVTSPEIDEIVLKEALAALAKSTQANPPSGWLSLCEATIKSKIAPAVAIVSIVFAVLLAGFIAFFVLPPRAPAPVIMKDLTGPQRPAAQPTTTADVNTVSVPEIEKPPVPQEDIARSITAPPAERKEVFELIVVNRETSAAIEGASVDFVLGDKEHKKQTDVEGRCIIELGDKVPENLSLLVRKEGFVPLLLSYPYKDARPEQGKGYMLLLEPGKSIGGIIVDEQGMPIEGVTVSLVIKAEQGIERAAIIDYPVKTDAEGKWRCDIVPWNFEYLGVKLFHQDYLDDLAYRTVTEDIEKLREMTAVMVMEKGALVTGVIVDAANQPVAGAIVSRGGNHLAEGYSQAKSNDNGWFEFANIRPSEIVLTVTARGFSPDLRKIAVSKETPPLEFILEPAQRISGKVIDPQGKPIEGAFVEAVQWREFNSIEWRYYTNSQGQFEWTEAPGDKVLFDVSKAGYTGIKGLGLVARQVPYEIILYPSAANP